MFRNQEAGQTAHAVLPLYIRPGLGELPQQGLRLLDNIKGGQCIAHPGLLLQPGGLHGRCPVQGDTRLQQQYSSHCKAGRTSESVLR